MQARLAKSPSFTRFLKASNSVDNRVGPNTVTLRFRNKEIAQAFFTFVSERIPLLNTELPKIDTSEVHLSDEQFLFCKRQAMCEKGQLTTAYLDNCTAFEFLLD